MAANAQSGQQRFTVVKLPVVQLVLESLALPFRHLPELVRYGWIPFTGSLVVAFLNWLLRRLFLFAPWSVLFVNVAHFALYTPFCVAWTRIAIEGSHAKLPDRPFAYERAEWQYAGATAVMLIATVVLMAPGLSVTQYGQATFSYGMRFLGGLLLLAGAVLVVVGFVRFAFVFPAIAIGRYRGIAPAWRQTAGNLEGLAVLVLLACAPFVAIELIMVYGPGREATGAAAVVTAIVQWLMEGVATLEGTIAPTLAYKWIVLGQGRRTTADPAVGRL